MTLLLRIHTTLVYGVALVGPDCEYHKILEPALAAAFIVKALIVPSGANTPEEITETPGFDQSALLKSSVFVSKFTRLDKTGRFVVVACVA